MSELERPQVHPVDRFLAPGGALAQKIPGYEARDAQLAFARDVADTLDAGGALLAEAPTGVGKSLGYLVPALLWSRREREPVVVSTHTKQLQGQLTDVDLPLVAGAFDPAPRVVRLKGKHNYLCPRRWKLHLAEHKKRGARATRAETAAADWVSATARGDLDEFDWSAHQGGAALRARIGFDPAFCNASACRPGGDCPWRKARRQAASAEIIVVNHALLVTGLPGTNVLPPYRALIVDEAHHLDPVLTSQMTVHQSYARLESLLALVDDARPGVTPALAQVVAGAATILSTGAQAELSAACDRLRDLAPELRATGHAFFAQVAGGLARRGAAAAGPYEPRARFRALEELLGTGGYDALERTLALARGGEDHGRAALAALSRAPTSPTLEDLAGDLAGIQGAWQEWHQGMKFLTDPRAGEHVYWSGGARPESAEIAAAPIEVAKLVRERLLPEVTSLVLTSATLATGGSFRYVRERLGLDEGGEIAVSERVYPSPFDFPRQLAAFVLDGRARGGEGGRRDEDTAAVVATIAKGLGRNTLVLFTSHLALRRAAKALRTALGEGAPVWAQDVDGSAVELARRFRAARGTLLLGTASFWEGVDFPGEALEVLVVTQLPFPVPTEPLIEARCEKLEAEHESGFARVMLPEAVLRFRQGIGRLLRRTTDRGVLAILDARVVEKGYGAHFRRGLPVPLRTVGSAAELTEQAAAFLGRRNGEVA